MSRRRFLLSLAAAPFAARLWAAPHASGRFLLVFLRGGYDAANVLVPVSSDFYYDSRPNISIPRRETLPLSSDWGLHPALRESLYPLWEKRELAFVPFAGTDDLTRSHFETQDGIELGQPLGGRRDYGSGFLNRLVARLEGAGPISFTDRLPIAFRGEARVTNIALRFAGQAAVDERQSRLIAEMYRDTALGAQVADGFAARDTVMRELSAEMEAASRNALAPRNFALEARRIARLMKSSYNVGFVDVGGWDTHVGQGGTTGLLAQRLLELGGGLAALADELGPAWHETVVAVISEFGRTWRENGNRGTDHGHGTVYWFLGGGVRGGRVAGEEMRPQRGSLHQDRDYPVLNEYRAVLGGLFGRMFGLRKPELDQVFAGVRPVDLGLL